MIIVGYQGIGKTTYCDKDKTAIDLESSSFSKLNPLWYKDYVSCAISLSQNRHVFVSSHKVVREELKMMGAKWVIVMPSIDIENIWLDRLFKRYSETLSDKDYRAFLNAREHYKDSINDLMNEDVKKYILNEKQYLSDIIGDIRK